MGKTRSGPAGSVYAFFFPKALITEMASSSMSLRDLIKKTNKENPKFLQAEIEIKSADKRKRDQEIFTALSVSRSSFSSYNATQKIRSNDNKVFSS